MSCHVPSLRETTKAPPHWRCTVYALGVQRADFPNPLIISAAVLIIPMPIPANHNWHCEINKAQTAAKRLGTFWKLGTRVTLLTTGASWHRSSLLCEYQGPDQHSLQHQTLVCNLGKLSSAPSHQGLPQGHSLPGCVMRLPSSYLICSCLTRAKRPSGSL